jgi:hypothetical protein
MTAKAVWEAFSIPGLALCEVMGLWHEIEEVLPQSKVCIVLKDEYEFSANDLELSYDNFYLQGIYNEVSIAQFRWEESFNFQASMQDASEASSWQWALYVRKESTDAVMKLVKKSLSYTSEFVHCAIHKTPLNKIKQTSNSSCYVQGCRNQINFKCLKGFPKTTCHSGICRRHYKEIESNGTLIYINSQSDVEPSSVSSNEGVCNFCTY